MTDDEYDADNPDQRPAVEREIDRADAQDEQRRSAGELCRAIATVARLHNFQTDKAGEPYICHVLRVMERADDPAFHLGGPVPPLWQVRLAALYHDAIEDGDGTFVTIEWLRICYGDDVADAVDALTYRPGEHRRRYLDRCRANAIALIVKQADLTDNKDPARLAKLSPAEQDRLGDKYANDWNYLIWELSPHP